MKTLILTLISFVCLNAQSTSSKLLLGFYNSNIEDIAEQNPSYNFFITNDGKYLKTSDGKYFIVPQMSGLVILYDKNNQKFYASDNKQILMLKDYKYIMTAFGVSERYSAQNIKDLENNLFVLGSNDGLNWDFITTSADINNLYVFRDGLTDRIRDPGLTPHKVGDYWFIAYTKDCFQYECSTFGVAKSKNLIDWEWVADINVNTMGATYVWVNGFVEDGDSTHLLVNISTNPDYWAEMNIYEMHPLNNDFTSWSNPRPIEANNFLNHNRDTYIYKSDSLYYMFFVAATTEENYLIDTSSNFYSGYGLLQEMNFGSQVEGYEVIDIGNLHYMYYDHFIGQGLYRSASADLKTWATSELLRTNKPKGLSHFSISNKE